MCLHEWDVEISNKSLEFNDDNIVTNHSNDDVYWANALGRMAIKKSDIQSWKFKLLSKDPDPFIGIIDTEFVEE